MSSSKPLKLFRMVLLRHGQSQWNLEKRFTGWQDISLSSQGTDEAVRAGRIMKNLNFEFDLVFTSFLNRSISTYEHICTEMGLELVPVTKAWQLNERHYGALTGLCKSETSKIYGNEQVKVWRRHFDILPPMMDSSDSRAPKNNPMYSHIHPELLPLGESLKTTALRTLPFFRSQILKEVLADKQVLVVAHNHSLRSIVKELDGISDEDIAEVSISTGTPLVYELTEDGKVHNKYFLPLELPIHYQPVLSTCVV
jgi:2,3-bisphosphoglycerate-dependent phosphoglycerate mutase